MFILKILRIIFITLDNVVYQCIDLFYQLFIMLAETGIFSGKAIQEFAGRIYFFLGLIMVFKVSISIIQYIMNPDMVKDSKMGAPKLLSNIVIILLGIVFIPYIFEAAFSLQRLILKDNVIGNLILGQTYQEGKSTDFIKNAGDRMAFSTFTAFFRFNDEIVSGECSNSPYDQDGNISSSCTEDPNYSYIEPFLSSHGDDYSKAYKDMNMRSLATDMDIYNYTVEVPNEQGKMKDKFLFSYMLLITTGAGGFIAYILLTFCFDVAVRSVKLGFLQLIAPIPLISKIDPKKGEEVFNKWVKECTSTYLSLFIRLVAIYFGLYIITLIGDGMFNVVTGEKENNAFVFVFIILGTLLFIKELPKLLETITGMKIDAKNGLSFNKKLQSVPLAGNPASKTLGLAGRTAGRMVKGVVTGKPGQALKDIGADFRQTGNEMTRGTIAKAMHGLGMKTAAEKQDAQVAALKHYAGYKEKLKNQANYNSTKLTGITYDGITFGANESCKSLKQDYEDLKASGTATQAQIKAARERWEKAQEVVITGGYTNSAGEEINDGSINAIKANAAKYVKDNSQYFDSSDYSTNPNASYSDINTGYIAANNRQVEIENSTSYERAHAAYKPPKNS